MSTPARVTSVEALEGFRATLLIYLDQAGRILDEAMNDVVRTRTWLEMECRQRWQREIRDRSRWLAQAEAELLTARLSGHPEAVQDRRLAVQRARRALEESEAGLERVRRWLRQYEPEVISRTQALHTLRQVLAGDMAKAVAYLENAVSTLAEYAGGAPPAPPSPGPAPDPPLEGRPQPS